jgi:hypothetical protein
MKSLPYLHSFWQHTDKGVRRGGNSKHVFAVVQVGATARINRQGKPVPWLLCWVCEKTPNTSLIHPVFDHALLPADPSMFVQHGANGVVPTMMFYPDSLYKRWKP